MPPSSLVNQFVIDEMCLHARAAPTGAFIEVGVYKGGSAYWLSAEAERGGRECWLYDTFEGIPYQATNDPIPVGMFNDTSYDAVALAIPYSHVIRGIYPLSAEGAGPEVIAAAHLDCDAYQSVRDAIRYILPRMPVGGLLWFDDAPGLPGAEQAVLEFFDERDLKVSHFGGKWFTHKR